VPRTSSLHDEGTDNHEDLLARWYLRRPILAGNEIEPWVSVRLALTHEWSSRTCMGCFRCFIWGFFQRVDTLLAWSQRSIYRINVDFIAGQVFKCELFSRYKFWYD
jgi:hypothetical protein